MGDGGSVDVLAGKPAKVVVGALVALPAVKANLVNPPGHRIAGDEPCPVPINEVGCMLLEELLPSSYSGVGGGLVPSPAT
jgi:hypothetical protein